ncbi:hypothetical protein FW778_18960 [Ginsengibacter hankyongi]|uniref:Uncharacterized protein n=1 Tax=Ginsengibacter hankyongi TaxID=2607284 RepID=A0A5J5IBK7_9BACT|nr:hypothetical protein [Ginsengibacter hankyongi]KAA9036317.1 hypothetical protein FW778_18960 [Ginsengibacter hankyongi]
MKNAFQLLTVLSVFTFFASCKKHHDQPVTPPVIAYDADAQKFFDSSAIGDTSQMSAVSDFVKQLKDSSLWAKFTAIYPMVGGSGNTSKWNLKNPVNSDAAYRLTFTGTPTFSSSGVLFPTTSDFADTHFSDSLLAYNDNSISYFSATQNTTDGYDMGCSDNVSPYNEFAIYHSSDATNWYGYYQFGITPASTKGLFMLSATAGDVKRFENGIMTMSKGASPAIGFTGLPILIGSVSAAPTVGGRECALATIGKGFSDAEALTFYNIVKNFEARLRR